MNTTAHTSTPDSGEYFDPRHAADLLDQTTQRARRKFEPFPPWLWLIRGIAVLATCGAIWWAVRGQHPYRGPTAAVLPVVFTFVVLNLVATLLVARHANIGVRGPSRLRPAEIAVMTAAWVGVFVVMGVLAGAAVSPSIVYGRYPTSVPLIVAGLGWAAVMAARANRQRCTVALVVAAIGVADWFAGPVGSWLVAGAGLFLVCLYNAVVIAHQQRA